MAEEKGKQLSVRREQQAPARFEEAFESPFTIMRRMREEIDRMFENFGFGSMLAPWQSRMMAMPNVEGMWAPACDVWETENEVKVKCDLPGVDPQNIDISATEDTLRIRAELRQEQEIEGRHGMHRTERRFGTFERQFTLPSGIKSDQAKATFRHGTVEITLPKTEEAKQKMRKIPVESEEEMAGTKGGQTGKSKK